MMAAWERQKGRKISEEHRQRLIESNTGKKWTEEQHKNYSLSRRGRPFTITEKWWAARQRGENHYKWKGGVNPVYGEAWPSIANGIRDRDYWTCLRCGKKNPKGAAYPVHHITPAADIMAVDECPHVNENLATLCPKHHAEADGNLEWSVGYYREKLMSLYGYLGDWYIKIDAVLANVDRNG